MPYICRTRKLGDISIEFNFVNSRHRQWAVVGFAWKRPHVDEAVSSPGGLLAITWINIDSAKAAGRRQYRDRFQA
jgi:hypothetical protein